MNYYVSILELIAFLASLLSLRMRNPIFKLICFILLLTLVTEWWLVPVFSTAHGLSSSLLYNLFSLADITVWCTIFYLVHRPGKERYFVLAASVLCLGYSLAELLFMNGWHHLHTDSFRVYNICIILFCLLYFYSKLKPDFYEMVPDPVFWICTACFLYHSILFVNFTTQASPAYWKLKNAEVFFYILHDTGNTFYYLLLIFSVVICYFRYSRQIRT